MPTETSSRSVYAEHQPGQRSVRFGSDSEESMSSRSRLRQPRSTAYTTPLAFRDKRELHQTTPKLTRHNLQKFLQEQEPAPPSASSTASKVYQTADVKNKSAENSSRASMPSKYSSKKKASVDSHPLNLPPDELRRLSAAMAREEARTSTPMDLDSDTPKPNGSSQPATPAKEAPGAFPDGEANGVNGAHDEERSPTPPPHRTPPIDPEQCKITGNKYFKAKDFDRAIQEYTKAVHASPKNPTYLSNRAAAYIGANKYDLALSDSLQAHQLDPSNEKILHRLARIYTSLGRPQDALDTYARIPSASATDTAAASKALQSINIAEKQIASDDGNGNMALWSIDQAKQTLGPSTPLPRPWQLLRARANLKIGSVNALGEVQGITQSLMRLNPNDTDAIVLAGLSFYLKDDKPVAGKTDYERAESYFRQALSLDPDNSDARTALRTMKKLERARNEANTAFKQSKFSQAIDLYTSALDIDLKNRITNAKLLGNRAQARIKQKEYSLAIEDCGAALKLDPTYARAKRTRAKAVGENGDWQAAVNDLKQLAEDNPTDNDLAKDLRHAEIELKKSKRKDYYKILGIDKDAGDKEIERAYKKKAAVLHPDKTQGDKEKEAQFKDCLEAKEILTDPQKRTMYDQGIDPNDPTSGMGGAGGFPGGMGGMGGGMQIDPEILAQLFTGGMGGGMGGGRFSGFGGASGPNIRFSTGGPGMGGRSGGFPFG